MDHTAENDAGRIEAVVSDALDPILAEYVGPPVPHEAIAIVLDMAQRRVVDALTRVIPPEGKEVLSDDHRK